MAMRQVQGQTGNSIHKSGPVIANRTTATSPSSSQEALGQKLFLDRKSVNAGLTLLNLEDEPHTRGATGSKAHLVLQAEVMHEIVWNCMKTSRCHGKS